MEERRSITFTLPEDLAGAVAELQRMGPRAEGSAGEVIRELIRMELARLRGTEPGGGAEKEGGEGR